MSRITFALVFVLFAVAVPHAHAQSATATLSGVVFDETDAVVPDVTITLIDQATSSVRTATTDAQGAFSLAGLAPGTYALQGTRDPFAPVMLSPIVLNVNDRLVLQIRLEVNAISADVTVAAAPPRLSTAAGVSAVVDQRRIESLPTNGRRVDSFVLLTPGVVPDGTFGALSFRGVASHNAFLTDGIDTTNQFWNENASRTRVTSPIALDAIQEFRVFTTGYTAEHGRAAGGVVTTVTRSGTNERRGTAYGFYRDRHLNAQDRYATQETPDTRLQIGASLGGPLVKDRLFLFANGEVFRRDFPGLNRIINPAFTTSNGEFNAACPAALTSGLTSTQCAAARDFVMRGKDRLVPRRADSELFFARVDWNASPAQRLGVSTNVLRWDSPNGIQTATALTNNFLEAFNADASIRSTYGRLTWNSTTGTRAVNELRVGWFWDRAHDVPNDAATPQTGPLAITIAGTQIGAAPDYPRTYPDERRIEIADTYTAAVGAHLLKMGGSVSRTRDRIESLRNQFGTYSYSTFAAFAADFSGNAVAARTYQSFTQSFGRAGLDMVTADYTGFIEDQWKPTPRLTVNAGLRYEYSDLPQPELANPDYPQTGRIHSPRGNWAPRLSVARTLGDRTVLRAGGGVFYGRFQGVMLQTLMFSNGLFQPGVFLTPATAQAPVFPHILADAAGLPAGNVSIMFAHDDFRSARIYQGDVTIERDFGAFAASVGYMWSRGYDLTTTRDVNIGPPGPPVTYRINDANGVQTGTYTTETYPLANRVDPRYQRVLRLENGGRSWYDGLVISLAKGMRGGIAVNAGYTWSHAIDTANQGTVANVLFFNTVRSTFDGDYHRDKGTSALDVRHRLVVSAVWEPTLAGTAPAAVRRLLNGWQFSQITTLQSAPPASSTVRVVGVPFAGAAYPTSLNGLGGSDRVPFLSFSNLAIDRIARVDVRMTRQVALSPRVRLNASFEVFNLFNRISDTAVLTEAYAATNGVLTPTPGLGRGSASGGYPDGTNARRAQIGLRLTF